ncbi:MAG: hypothetical protein R3D85_01490 [Paracoccaceae bacterium]
MIHRTKALSTLALAALIGLPDPAAALSCRRPDVARSYKTAAAAPEAYVVVLGRLAFAADRLPKRGKGGRIRARLTGHAVTATGLGARLDRTVTLNVTCVSAWCGSATPGQDMLMFLRQDGADYVLDATPCQQFHFPDPPEADLATLRRCLAGGPCSPRSR